MYATLHRPSGNRGSGGLCPPPHLHCKFLPHENYGEWELQGPCKENLYYLRKRAVWKELRGNPVIIIGPAIIMECLRNSFHTVLFQRLDSADFPCRDPEISSPRSFYGQNNGSVLKRPQNTFVLQMTFNYISKLYRVSVNRGTGGHLALQIFGPSIGPASKSVLCTLVSVYYFIV